LFFNDLVLCHVESNVSQLRSLLPDRCSGLDFGSSWTPRRPHCNNKTKSTRREGGLVSTFLFTDAKDSSIGSSLGASQLFPIAARPR
jgi:hypothetical protein